MEIMEFCQKVKRSLTDCVGETETVTIREITKNNGIILHSIVITEKELNISPNIYLDELYEAYERGETFRTVMDEIRQIYKESRIKERIDMNFFMDYEQMKDKVLYKLISYEKNKELLLQVPYIPFLDFAIVFYCYVPKRELENATILIYNSHLKMWKIGRDRLHQDAKRNTERVLPAKICGIEDMMREIFMRDMMEKIENKNDAEKEVEKEAIKRQAEKTVEQMMDVIAANGETGRMYVLGNDRKLFGAAAMLYPGLLEAFADKTEKNFFILPSSVHEVIIVPDNEEQEAEELWKMVCDINATQVEPEEVLTDSVYYFSRKVRRIERLF